MHLYLHSADAISKLILQHSRIDPNMKNDDGNTPLHLACRSSNAALVKILVRDERCNLNEKNSNGDTALHVACGQYQSGKIHDCTHTVHAHKNGRSTDKLQSIYP